MRIRVSLSNPTETTIPINYQELLTGAIYRLLGESSAEYARFLHDDGYAPDAGRKRFKLFVFSNLRASGWRAAGDRLVLSPGPIFWYIDSPVNEFLVHLATGLLGEAMLQVGRAAFPVASVETAPAPDFSGGHLRMTCLSPVVAAVSEEGKTRYLRPHETEAFSAAVQANLLGKYLALHGRLPEDDRLEMAFDGDYLAARRGGTKLITFKGIQIVGAFAPFTATGSPALLETGYTCGFGEKNAGGFGMVGVWERGKGGKQ
ncbi:MAG: CRISPR-associated endoribonuclease Cas6 [Armatimonadetes bacterium]|nr:CRISPR-associated endoribonuclease Cas6 [Armatimonadota bacterium]